ncbi:MAG TPA: hypothetical protein VK184_20115 [Nostocaceae cyanobacterium]|nr:hypothetical protein [Nostocaceae cyanobacterium]
MDNWQFLIQKQGDRSWHILESPNLTIQEGNYRILARSYLPNTDVEVRVTHFSIQPEAKQRRILKRMRRTNAEGLVAVVPFTYFKPGIWDLRCSGDLMTDIFGESWQQNIQIQVIASDVDQRPTDKLDQESELESLPQNLIDSSFILTMGDESAVSLPGQNLLTAVETEEDKIINQPVSPVWFKGETAEQILQNLIDLALPAADTLLEETKVNKALPLPAPPPLKFSLAQDTYIAEWGERLTISGRVDLPQREKTPAEKFMGKTLSGLELVVELRSPLESKVLNQVKQDLINQTLPIEFSTSIEIPAHCESKLILADIRLSGAIASSQPITLLASHAFTITADVTELLAITTTPASNLEAFTNVINKQPLSVELGLELFNIAKTSQIAQVYTWKPVPNKRLPPRIHSQAWETDHGNSPQLPKLPQNQKQTTANGVVEEAVKKSPSKTAIDLDKLVIKQQQPRKQKTALPYLKRLPPKPTSENSIQLPAIASTQKKVELPLNQPRPATEPSQTAVTEISSINLQIPELVHAETIIASPLLRQWLESQGYTISEAIESEEASESIQEVTKEDEQEENIVEPIQELTNDNEQKADITEPVQKLTNDDVEVSPEIEPQLGILAETQPNWFNQEVVIDDTVLELEPEVNTVLITENQEEPTSNVPHVLLESLPIPKLYLPDGELVAGTSIKVKVAVEEVAAPVVVKLWVEDYQTRALLDGPHLLTDLLPNPLGSWEGVIHLIVPFGCLEIRMEAIALNITTKQESHKVTIVKPVIPPDLPVIKPDEILGL